MLQFKKKVSQNRTKLQQTTNNNKQQTTNNKRPFFLPKINKVFLRPILQNLKGRSVLDKFFFENDPLDEPNQMPPSKKFNLLSKLVKNAKWWSKSSLPLSHSTAKFFPLKKGFKKKSKPKSDKVATNNNKQQQTTNNKRPFFLPKINKVFLRPILQNLKGRSVLDKFFFENDPLDELNQMPLSKKFYLFRKLVKNAK